MAVIRCAASGSEPPPPSLMRPAARSICAVISDPVAPRARPHCAADDTPIALSPPSLAALCHGERRMMEHSHSASGER
ncbi:unnamed protein product [Lota lota]